MGNRASNTMMRKLLLGQRRNNKDPIKSLGKLVTERYITMIYQFIEFIEG